MARKNLLYLIPFILIISTLACSLSGVRRQVQSIEQTAGAVRTDVGGIVSAGESILSTARAIETQRPGILETAKALVTRGAPVISTVQAVATDNPGLIQTAQALVDQNLPSGEPPTDIPIIDPENTNSILSSSQYILYTTPVEYPQVLEFYRTEMPNNGWSYLEDDSHEYANAAQLDFAKDSRTASINLSKNPLNNTTMVAITLSNP